MRNYIEESCFCIIQHYGKIRHWFLRCYLRAMTTPYGVSPQYQNSIAYHDAKQLGTTISRIHRDKTKILADVYDA